MLVFGPVPSRRLGRSLGINNIPPKNCSYSCLYCQVGRTNKLRVERDYFYDPNIILDELKGKLKVIKEKSEQIDYISIVPDGEPTLDLNLGYLIEQIKSEDYKVAVITNSSLLHRKDVVEDLKSADLVSVKIDTVDESVWRRINRPYGKLLLKTVLDGIEAFVENHKGTIITETMIITDINDGRLEIEAISDFIKSLNTEKSFLLTPIRPPAGDFITPTLPGSLERAYHIFKQKGIDTQIISNYEGNNFTFLNNVEEEILSITSVHPMSEEAMKSFIQKANAKWEIVESLVEEEKLNRKIYSGKTYFIKN